MDNLIGVILSFTLTGLCLAAYIRVFVRYLRNKKAVIKVAEAKVIDKQFYVEEIISKMSIPHKKENYILKFEDNNRKGLTFSVSEVEYKTCEIGDRGKLKYKGDKFIDFE